MARRNNKSSSVVRVLKMIFNHYIVKNVLILFFAGGFIYYGTLVILRHYTHHGEALTVPDVKGLTLDEAGQLLQAQKMRWQLSDSVYVNSAEPGAVVNQNPESGSRVKENRNVFLIINAMTPEMLKMPYVVDMSYRQAKTTLESQGFSIGKLTYVPHIAENYVLRQLYRGQEISGGTEIVKGSEIELVLGQGLSDERISVPGILGYTLPEARKTLTEYFLNIGVPIYDETVITSADTVNAFIFQQRPEAGVDAMLQLGSIIDVWLTVDETKKPDMPTDMENE